MPRAAKLLILAVLLAGGTATAATDRAPEAMPKVPFQIVPINVAQSPAVATDGPAGVRPARGLPLTPRAGLVAPVEDQPLPLAPPRRGATGAPARSRDNSPTRALSTVVSSVAVVLGLFALLVWVTRRTRPRNHAALPGEVLETLGRVPLNGRQEMHLVRVGNKLLLLSVTATAAETLTEITDPDEIERLAGICRHGQSDGISGSLREMLAHLGKR